MRPGPRRRVAAAVVAALSALACLAASAGDALEWDNPKKALARARQEGRPAMISWETTWCPYCKKMRRDTWSDPGVQAALQGFVSLAGDAQRYGSLADRYGVEIYPTIVFTAPSGAPVLVVRGAQSATSMVDRLLAVWEDRERLADLADRADGKKPDGRALVELAAFATDHEALPYAEGLLRKAVALHEVEPATAIEARLKLAAILLLTERCQEAGPIVAGGPRPVPEPFAAQYHALEEQVGHCDG